MQKDASPKTILSNAVDNSKPNVELFFEGFYGKIRKGILQYPKPRPNVEVLIKTNNEKNMSKNDFKRFLNELKTLTFVGHHENIVGLIAAWTRDIAQGRLLNYTKLQNLINQKILLHHECLVLHTKN
jgi:serine/threonine protein kinase